MPKEIKHTTDHSPEKIGTREDETEFKYKSSIFIFFFSYFIRQSSKLGLGLYSILLLGILEIFLL